MWSKLYRTKLVLYRYGIMIPHVHYVNNLKCYNVTVCDNVYYGKYT